MKTDLIWLTIDNRQRAELHCNRAQATEYFKGEGERREEEWQDLRRVEEVKEITKNGKEGPCETYLVVLTVIYHSQAPTLPPFSRFWLEQIVNSLAA